MPMLIGTSLKMYFSHARTVAWVTEVAAILAEHPADVTAFVIPQYPSIPACVEHARDLLVGAQDVATDDEGAFTGEVSAAVLAELGCRYVEVGHAERRRLFGDTDEVVAAKTYAALRNGLVPIVCIGEPDRVDADAAADACIAQLRSALSSADAAGVGGEIVVAYEPLWAIGAPEPAAPEHIRGVCRRLKEFLSGREGRASVIYGGSAGPGLLTLIADDVDGLFLGRFAHDPAAVRDILDEAGAVAA
ncbi:triose-phosphate isomerase family protein [Microbacterium sp. NPDC055903]